MPASKRSEASTATEWLPILIIPGFMSSGLEIKESKLRPSWEGKRIWLNLGSLGLSAMYFGKAQKKNDFPTTTDNTSDVSLNAEEKEQLQYKSAWLEHMRLNRTDMRTETNGVKVRAIPGLLGVNYLTPGTFTNMVSYVFGPVIQALLKAGYEEGKNLQAASYDWRLPPSELERRDSYFTRTIKQVEKLYATNHSTPVVIVGHSLGTKTAHYFLNFCLAKKGQSWIDKHIHTYIPVGAPHIGAPKALRSMISGDKMSLDAFLSDEEALTLGRSFGSGPWLLPQTLPAGVPSSAYVLPHGVLEISIDNTVDTEELTEKRRAHSRPSRFQLIVVLGSTARKVKTPFHSTLNTKVVFDDKISFATLPTPLGPNEGALQFFLQEPGISAAKYERSNRQFNPILCCLNWLLCCCIWTWAYYIIRGVLCGVVQTLVLSADALTSVTDHSTNLALSDVVVVPSRVWKGQEAEIKVTLHHKDDYGKYDGVLCFMTKRPSRTATLVVKMKWIPFHKEKSSERICSPICQSEMEGRSPHIVRGDRVFQEYPGYEIIEREGLTDALKMIKDVYDGDSKLDPRNKSSYDAPPVRKIHAIYGVNLPTEIGSIYKRKDTYFSGSNLKNLYKLDSKAILAENHKHNHGYVVKGGILMETKKTPQAVAGGRKVSGDGTVPYWSLQHCKTWASAQREVTVVEIDKAEHREILADARFHEALLQYCKIRKESV